MLPTMPAVPPVSVAFRPILPTTDEVAAVYPAVFVGAGPQANIKTAETEKARKAAAEPQWAEGRAARRVQYSAAVAALRDVGATVALRPIPETAYGDPHPLPADSTAARTRDRMRRTVRVLLPRPLRDRSGYATSAWYIVPFGRGYALTAGSVAAEEAVYRQTERPMWLHATTVSTKHRDARAALLSALYVMLAGSAQ